MKTTFPLRIWTAALLLAALPLAAQTPVRILGDNVNLRAKPQLGAEVVAQAQYGTVFAAREIGEEWVEIAAPASLDVWISKDLVQIPENVVRVRRANVRAGPSINYNVVGTVERGAPVEIRGETSEWLKIAPPPDTHVWVHRDFAEVQAAEAPAAEQPAAPARKKQPRAEPAALAEAAPPAPEMPAAEPATVPAPEAAALPTPIVSPSVPTRDDVRSIPVPPPADLRLIPLEGQGRLAIFEGELRPAPLINEAPTRYRVVRWQNNRWQILCHVYGEAARLRSLQDKTVRVRGREYWIQGAAAPVLVPDQIEEIVRQ